MLIKRLSPVVEGMYQQGADTGILRNSGCPSYGILQECATWLHTLDVQIHSQPGEHQYRHRVWHIAVHGACGRSVQYRTSSHYVIAMQTPGGVLQDKTTAGAA